MKKRIFKAIFFLFLGILLLVGYSILYKRTGWGIPCMIHETTGLYCPGCGLTRMIFSMFQLDFPKAFRYNQLMFIMFPFLLFYIGVQIRTYIRGEKENLFTRIPNYIYVIILIIVLAWGVVRNIPAFPMLRP